MADKVFQLVALCLGCGDIGNGTQNMPGASLGIPPGYAGAVKNPGPVAIRPLVSP